MTTLLSSESLNPGTHLLVIGVGTYDHLVGGSGTQLDQPYGLRQLGSPPASAKQFSEWALSDLSNPAAPLASVEAVISSDPATTIDVPGQGKVEIEPATMANITAAFDLWHTRANAHAGNVAIFYHCGHGLESSDLALLAQDFGSPGGDPPQPWANAYNFHRTYRGMARCISKAQFFFIDSCRQVSADLLEFDGLDIAPLISPRLRGLNTRNAPILYASAREAKAFARRGEVSRFTTALIQALNTNAARNSQGSWQVSNLSLAEAVIKRLERTNVDDAPVQNCVADGESAGTSVIHVLDAPPAIPAFVWPAPSNAYPSTVRLEFLVGDVSSIQAIGPAPWSLDVTAGVYTLRATDGASVFSELSQEWVLPPEYEREIP